MVGACDMIGGDAAKAGLEKRAVEGDCIAVISGKDERYLVPDTYNREQHQLQKVEAEMRNPPYQ